MVCDLLVENFPHIFDTAYTAKLETERDDIEEGTEKWTILLSAFYDHFEKELKVAAKEMRNIKRLRGGDEMRSAELCVIAAGAQVGQVRNLLCMLDLQQERSDELHVYHRRIIASKPDLEHPWKLRKRAMPRTICDNCGKVADDHGGAGCLVRSCIMSGLQRGSAACKTFRRTESEAAAENHPNPPAKIARSAASLWCCVKAHTENLYPAPAIPSASTSSKT